MRKLHLKSKSASVYENSLNAKDAISLACFWLSAVVMLVTLILGLIAVINLSKYLNSALPTPDSEIIITGGDEYLKAISTRNGYLSTVLSLVPYMFWLGLGATVLMAVSYILKLVK